MADIGKCISHCVWHCGGKDCVVQQLCVLASCFSVTARQQFLISPLQHHCFCQDLSVIVCFCEHTYV